MLYQRTVWNANEFMNAYPGSDFRVISRKAYIDFISGNEL